MIPTNLYILAVCVYAKYECADIITFYAILRKVISVFSIRKYLLHIYSRLCIYWEVG